MVAFGRFIADCVASFLKDFSEAVTPPTAFSVFSLYVSFVRFPLSMSSSITLRRSFIESGFVSIWGLHILITAISISTLFCTANLRSFASSENTRIYLISCFSEMAFASCCNSFILSAVISTTSAISSAVFARSTFLMCQIKSFVKVVISLPCIKILSITLILSVTDLAHRARRNSENTDVSTAPSTSRALSYVISLPRKKDEH